MNDPATVPVIEQAPNAEADLGRCPTCGRRIRREGEGAKTKSGAQRRFDQLTREKYQAQRAAETLRGDVAAAVEKLKQAEDLLRQYKGELEKYRARFVEIAAKEKHGKR